MFLSAVSLLLCSYRSCCLYKLPFTYFPGFSVTKEYCSSFTLTICFATAAIPLVQLAFRYLSKFLKKTPTNQTKTPPQNTDAKTNPSAVLNTGCWVKNCLRRGEWIIICSICVFLNATQHTTNCFLWEEGADCLPTVVSAPLIQHSKKVLGGWLFCNPPPLKI